jgi:hypothetical protein
MKIKVIKKFRDKNRSSVVFEPGKVIADFDEARAKSLVQRGLAEVVKEKEKEKDKEPS